MPTDDLELRTQARREAAPAAAAAAALLAALAAVSYAEEWTLVGGLGWWIWLVLGLPAVVLAIDLAAGVEVTRTRAQALALVRVLAAANLLALGILVAGLVSTSTRDLGGAELLLTAAVLWLVNVIVFGIWFWELDAGGAAARVREARTTPDFQFPQDENSQLAEPGWRPTVWDYAYVALTNAIAFSPTDAMPLTRHAKALMAVESVASVVAVLLVAARAVNVLGS